MGIDHWQLSAKSCRDARELLRMSKEDLAKRAEISVSTIRRLERGDPSVADYSKKRIAEALAQEGVMMIGSRAVHVEEHGRSVDA